MPLQITQKGPLMTPVIVCDHCAGLISDVKDGNFEWKFETQDEDESPRIAFTHKECCHPFEQQNPGHWYCEELDCLFVYLANSLSLNWDKAKLRASLLAQIGESMSPKRSM